MIKRIATGLIFTVTISTLPIAVAQSPNASDRAKEVAAIKAFWTAERIASAQPRDLVVDQRGLWYLKGRQGKLTPYGHSTPAQPEPQAPGGNGGGRGGGGNGGGKPGGGDTGGGDTGEAGFENVKNAEWLNGGHVQTAAGRILFGSGKKMMTRRMATAREVTLPDWLDQLSGI